MPGVVVDSAAMRGLRWEIFTTLSSLAPCLNLNQVVFGPDASYAAWLEEAHASLVAFPSEEPLFQLMRQGYFGPAGAGPPQGLPGRLLSLAMGGSEATGGCTRMFGEVAALR